MSNGPLPDETARPRLVVLRGGCAQSWPFLVARFTADERGERVRTWLARQGYTVDRYLNGNFKRYYLAAPKLSGLFYEED